MDERYKSILLKLQNLSVGETNMDENEFYERVVKSIFIKEMKYKTENSSSIEYKHTFQTEDMVIRSFVNGTYEKELFLLSKLIKERDCTWGILIHAAGICLINSKVGKNSNDNFKNSDIVLEIIYGLNTDQKYFKFFSAENTIGERKNACFFKDIIDYKNNIYKGTEKSWYAYHSGLKRFLAYFADHKGDYGYEDNIYDSIEYAFFVEFVKKGTSCKSLTSARNLFFYIKDFMQEKSKKKEFDNPDWLKISFPEFMPKDKRQDVFCIDKLKIALKFLERNKSRNGIRNKTLLLFLLAYGMERRKLCALKWENINFRNKLLIIDKKRYPMPTYLLEMLRELENQRMAKEYIFCNRNGEALSDGAVNTILSGISRVDMQDGFYSQLTPANIRRYLAKYLMEHAYPLEKILYIMDIEGYKLESYIPTKDIEKAFWRKCEEPVVCPEGQHPMEGFLEKLR